MPRLPIPRFPVRPASASLSAPPRPGLAQAAVPADGSIVTDPSWSGLVELGAESDDDGMQLLDARGRPLPLPLPPQHIGRFHQGYALVYSRGAARMADRAGKTYALPDAFDTEVAAAGLVRFAASAAEDAPWGLYGFIEDREAAAPQYTSIGSYRGELAVASLGPDRPS